MCEQVLRKRRWQGVLLCRNAAEGQVVATPPLPVPSPEQGRHGKCVNGAFCDRERVSRAGG